MLGPCTYQIVGLMTGWLGNRRIVSCGILAKPLAHDKGKYFFCPSTHQAFNVLAK